MSSLFCGDELNWLVGIGLEIMNGSSSYTLVDGDDCAGDDCEGDETEGESEEDEPADPGEYTAFLHALFSLFTPSCLCCGQMRVNWYLPLFGPAVFRHRRM